MTEPRCYHCYHCGHILADINTACPICLPNFYAVPRGTHPHWSTTTPTLSRLPVDPPQEPWECADALGVRGVELVSAHLQTCARAAGYAELGRLAVDGGPFVALPPIRRRYGRSILGAIGIVVLVLGGAAVLYGARGAERNPMIASTDPAEVCANDGMPGSAYSRRHRVVARRPVPGHQIDHVVPLCLGGADTEANIEIQPIDEALVKDQIEKLACIAVCRTHTMTLAEGQAIFLGRWQDHLWRIGR